MSLKTLNESLEKILLLETKQDIQKFIDKFGEENYELFNKSLQRLKNNGYSTDIIYYTQKVSKEELEDLLSKLQRRLQTKSSNDTSSEGVRGKYNYLGESKGYKVYQPLDYLSSVDLGYNTGWCTTGRFGHTGEKNFKPSEEEAKKHFKDYTSKGIELYYFLDSKTMEGKYAIALYPKLLGVNKFIGNYYLKETNFELFNQEDEIDYSALNKIPYQLLPEKLIIDKADAENGLYIKNNILVKVDNNIKEAIIPNNVTSIGDFAFSCCESLTSITIPNNVKSIGDFAFEECSSLTSITIPDSVTSIGDFAFDNCSNLTSITLPNSVTSIGEYVFKYCESLTDVTISNNITYISDFAFSHCQSLTHITLPNSVTSIGVYAFSYCTNLTDITIPNSVVSIGNEAFRGCSALTNIEIPNSVTSIGNNVFDDCSSLTDITIPDSVISIDDFTFYDCSNLTNITIPNSVISIGRYTFSYCDSLRDITIPNNVKSIGYNAFSHCDSLTDVYYTGTEEEWNEIEIDWGNEHLLNANIHFNSKINESLDRLIKESENKPKLTKTRTDLEDLTGKQFGELTAIEYDKEKSRQKGETYWVCQCSCGKIVSVAKKHLRNGDTTSCGHKQSQSGIDHQDNFQGYYDSTKKYNTNINAIKNQNPQSNNTSGVKGVDYHSGRKMWRARIRKDKKEVTKWFKNKEDAIKWRNMMVDDVYKPILDKAKENGDLKESYDDSDNLTEKDILEAIEIMGNTYEENYIYNNFNSGNAFLISPNGTIICVDSLDTHGEFVEEATTYSDIDFDLQSTGYNDVLDYFINELGFITLNDGDGFSDDRCKIVIDKRPTQKQYNQIEKWLEEIFKTKEDLIVYCNGITRFYELEDLEPKDIIKKIQKSFVSGILEALTNEELLNKIDLNNVYLDETEFEPFNVGPRSYPDYSEDDIDYYGIMYQGINVGNLAIRYIVKFNTTNLVIEGIHIKKDFQKLGIGKKAIEILIKEYSKYTPLNNIIVDAIPSAMDFYKKLGFKPYSKNKKYNMILTLLKPIKESVNQEEMSNEYDSEGNQLTKAQAEFFKNSKVRDKNGRLLVCYHGTSYNFDIFDKEKSGSASNKDMSEYGFFFGDKTTANYHATQSTLDWSDGYGYKISDRKPIIMGCYLNLKNPLIADTFDRYAESELQLLQQAHSQWYDGLIYTYDGGNITYWVAFYPNQIKSITNKNPTDSDNINEKL